MKIGIIGAGYIGRALARLAIAHGHDVMISNSRDPVTLASTAIALGCETGTAVEAGVFGEVVIVSIPFGAYDKLDAGSLSKKVVLDTCNYYPHRDGVYPKLDDSSETTGELLARHLPESRVVKAFNAILQDDLRTSARSAGASARRALPVAGDDKIARNIVAGILDQFGFDVVDAGPMTESWRFERGMPAYCVPLNRAELVDALAAAKRGERVVDGSWRQFAKPDQAKNSDEGKLIGVAGRGELDIVDSQIHLMLEPTVSGTLAAMDALGIRSVILDEFWEFDAEGLAQPCVRLDNQEVRPIAVHALGAAMMHPSRFAFVQRVNRNDPELDKLIPLLKSTPGCVGIRIVLSSRNERTQFAEGGWDIVLRLATEMEMPINFLTSDMSNLAAIAKEKFPDLQLILDHCGWGSSLAQWEDILKLAGIPKTYLKWSHARRTFKHSNDPAKSESKALVQAIEAFGANRLMWASDVTHEETRLSWAELLDFPRSHSDISNDDRGWILGGTVRKVYNWNGK